MDMLGEGGCLRRLDGRISSATAWVSGSAMLVNRTFVEKRNSSK